MIRARPSTSSSAARPAARRGRPRRGSTTTPSARSSTRSTSLHRLSLAFASTPLSLTTRPRRRSPFARPQRLTRRCLAQPSAPSRDLTRRMAARPVFFATRPSTSPLPESATSFRCRSARARVFLSPGTFARLTRFRSTPRTTTQSHRAVTSYPVATPDPAATSAG